MFEERQANGEQEISPPRERYGAEESEPQLGGDGSVETMRVETTMSGEPSNRQSKMVSTKNDEDAIVRMQSGKKRLTNATILREHI